jgi:hypothetical protein
MLYQLNLPPLPDSIINEVLTYSKSKLEILRGSSYNCDLGWGELSKTTNIVGRFNTGMTFKSKSLREWFSEYLPIVKYEELFLLVNRGEGLAEFPAHCDKDRNLAINYVFSSGGNNVVTSTYTGPQNTNLSSPKYIFEEELILDTETVVPVNSWYVFDASYPHAVKNIESVRIVLVSRSKDNMSLEDFVIRFSHLLK